MDILEIEVNGRFLELYPDEKILENTLSGLPVWSRVVSGVYKATLASEFQLNKVLCYVSSTSSSNDSQWIILKLERVNNNDVFLTGFDVQNSESLMDDDLSAITIKIEVYN